MDDEDLIEAEGSIVFEDGSMFGNADEAPEEQGFGSVMADDESEADLLGEYAALKPFGYTWAFDFSTGQFETRGAGRQEVKVEGREAFAQWCMQVLHTERLTALVYSDQIGVEFESVVRQQGASEMASSLLLTRIEEALAVHDRYDGIEDFSALVDDDLVHIKMILNTNEGAVEVAGSVAS